jgi:outer membrane protein OmpA-like peptidoglycan-associated protein/tetratricopeptide (TPR) repeat protein
MDPIKKIALACLFIMQAFSLPAADNKVPGSDNKFVRKADNLFIFGDYRNAMPIYARLVESNPENAQFNYRLGVCYYFSGTDILRCLPHFEKARKNYTEENEESIELYYYLGTTYHMLNRFDEAIECYTKLKTSILPDKQGLEDIKDLEEQIAACNRGKEMIKTRVPVQISDLGSNVNSEYADYAPVISGDQSMLMFTSKRKESTGGRIDEDGNYYEDIFITKKLNMEEDWQVSEKLDSSDNIKKVFMPFLFSKSKSMGNSINTREHDASVALSPDGKQLYIYRLDDVWVSDYKNDKWNRPSKLNNFINSKKDHEPSVSLTMDEKTLYFVSEREGGFGGKDIYKSEKQSDGSWGEPVNLGAAINTELDEDAPFIDPENKVLYFSSEAHGSIGGFDIFRSKQENHNWTKPENLGYPVNSGANDIFYVYNNKTKTAYFSSLREGGKGNYDIYLADYNPPKPQKTLKMLLAVTLNNKNHNMPVLIDISGPGIQNNSFVLSGDNREQEYLPGEIYTMTITGPDNQKHVTSFTIPAETQTGRYYQEVAFEEIKDNHGKVSGYKTVLYNSFFDLDSAVNKTEFAKLNNKTEAYSSYLESRKDLNDPELKIISFNEKETEEKVIVNNNSAAEKTNLNISPAHFEFAQSKPDHEGLNELKKAAEILSSDTQLKIKITGHTDSKGDERFNQRLSEQRALSAAGYLMSKGISSSRIITEGKGEKEPAASETKADGSDNEEGRKQNRRVEFSIFKTNISPLK